MSLTICPLLSLGADQEEKFNLKALDVTGPVVSIHLDKIRSLANQHYGIAGSDAYVGTVVFLPSGHLQQDIPLAKPN
jgi:hypothetical protein